jgi:hypothetical protein
LVELNMTMEACVASPPQGVDEINAQYLAGQSRTGVGYWRFSNRLESREEHWCRQAGDSHAIEKAATSDPSAAPGAILLFR